MTTLGPAGAPAPSLICDPPVSEWRSVVAENRAQAADWAFSVEGMPATVLRARARRRVL